MSRKLCFVYFALTVAYSLFGDVSIDGRNVLVDGERFIVRGICYNPTPLGDNVNLDPPHGDYFTSQYAAQHERDLPYLRAMGANVLRVYNWEPGVDHSGFLDACHNGGEQRLKVMVNRWIDPASDWSNSNVVAAIADQFVSMANEIKGHPAGFGVIIGNEVNEYHGNGSKAAFWAAMNTVALAVKEEAPGLLVTMAITDRLPQVAAYDSVLSGLDAWSVQVYRGGSFGSFFSDYASRSEKPLLITEFGYDNYDNRASQEYPDNGAYPAETVVGLIEESWNAKDVCSGVFVFSYLDGLWKSEGSDTEYDFGGWANPGFDDGFSNEEWWGIFRPKAVPGEIDEVEPRALYGALRNLWGRPEELSLDLSADETQWNFDISTLPLRQDEVVRIEAWDEQVDRWIKFVSFTGASFSPTERSIRYSFDKEAGLFRAVATP